MNQAQRFYAELTGMADHPDADLRLAVEQTQHERDAHWPPHRMRGTLKKPKRRPSSEPRLLKGLRP